MRIIRNALVRLFDKKLKKIDTFNYTSNNIVTLVTGIQFIEGDSLHVVISSTVKLNSLPNLDSSNKLIIPLKEVKLAESEIEIVACLLAVKYRTSKKIYSPAPYFMFAYEKDAEKKWLDSSEGYELKYNVIPVFDYNILNNIIDLNHLKDRKKGAVLLAEALCHSNNMGKYRDYMRLFEHAFSRPITAIDKKLHQFLSGFDGAGYTRKEVKEWISLRHPSSHADKKNKIFLLESDVTPFIQRIEQAAYDVLCNKKEWGDFSKERRNIYLPTIWTHNDTCEISSSPNTKSFISLVTYDHFGSFITLGVVEYKLSEKSILKIWGEDYSRGFGKVKKQAVNQPSNFNDSFSVRTYIRKSAV